MAVIKYITKKGKEIIVEGENGSLMSLAVDNNVRGIYGDCGGVCSCATCHVHILPEFWEIVGPANQTEADTLEFEENVTDHSRLACQINIKPELDGVTVKVAND